MSRQLLIATTNKGKIRELKALLAGLGAKLVTPADLGLQLDVAETGATYVENARLKAEAFFQASGIPALADDSGLEVDALDGAPGVFSARFSPLPNPTDHDRRSHLVSQLAGRPRPWTARFRCLVAVAGLAAETAFFEGVCEGQVVPEARGSNGFGYDPVFLLLGRSETMAELPEAEKNHLSHRAKAVLAARNWLAQFYGAVEER